MSNLATSLSVKEIELAIVEHHGGFLKCVAVPNVKYGIRSWGRFAEADLIVLNSAGRATEWEIKRSWLDFMNDFKKKDHVHYRDYCYYFAYAVPECIAERAKAVLEKRYTNYDMPAIYTYSEGGTLSKSPICGRPHPKVRDEKGCNREMTTEERLQLGRLASLRYWGIVKKMIKNKEKL